MACYVKNTKELKIFREKIFANRISDKGLISRTYK